mgnify:CR=1 FL=1
MAGVDGRPVIDPVAFGADTAGPALPAGVVQLRCDVFELVLLSRGVGVDGVLRYRHHITDSEF